MDITLDLANAYDKLRASATDEALDAAFDEGAKAAAAALVNEQIGSPLFVMEEMCINPIQSAYAQGWNRTLFKARADKGGSERSGAVVSRAPPAGRVDDTISDAMVSPRHDLVAPGDTKA